MAQRRHLRVSTLNGVVVVHFVDEWLTNDIAFAELGKQLLALAAQEDCSRLLLSFVGVTYISSAMVGTLISLNKQLEAKGGRLTLCELAPTVDEVFTTMKLNKILNIQSTEGEGLKRAVS